MREVIRIKEIVIIYNLHSGKKEIRRDLKSTKEIFKGYGYSYSYIKTKYKEHAKEIVENLREVDLVITIGGDGTFNESVSGNLRRKKPLTLSHIPVGTTNDLGSIFCLGKNMIQNLHLILSGETSNIDICIINNRPFVYVGGFGKFMNIPYDTCRKQKKKLGYLAYVLNIVKDFITGKTKSYDIEYEVNGETHKEKCSFAIISNSNQIAGIKNFYKDVKINDGQFEVLICNLRTRTQILRGLIAIASSNVKKSQGFKYYRTNNLKIKFDTELEKPWCVDGEKYDGNTLEYEIKVDNSIKMLLPKIALKK